MKKSIRTIEQEYYECGVKGHNHFKENQAIACLTVKLNKHKDLYKRSRIALKVLTTRTTTRSIARQHGVTIVIVRNSVVIVCKAIYKKLSGELKLEHKYKKTLENIA